MNYRRTLVWYWKIYSKQRKLLLGSWLLFQAGFILSTLLNPALEAHLIQKVVDGSLTTEYLVWFTVLYIFVRFVLAEGFVRFGIYLNHKQFTQGLKDTRIMAYERILDRDATFHNDNFSGALLNKITTFAGASAAINAQVLFSYIPLVITLLVTCVYTLYALPMLGAVTIVVSLLTVIYTYRAIGKRAVFNRKMARHRSNAVGHMADGLTNISATKAEAAEETELAIVDEELSEMVREQLQGLNYKNIRIDLVTSLSAKFIQTIALVVSIIYVMRGEINIATLYLVLNYVTRVSLDFFKLSETIKSTEEQLSNAQEMTQILEEEYEPNERTGSTDIKVARGQIDLLGVSFRYIDNDKEQSVFENLTLTITPGQNVGIVGHSGSGKSTLTSLLLRFNDPVSGEIRIDGQDISMATRKSLAAAIAYVPQEPLLFHRSIRDNIAYGSPDATDRQVKLAAKKAHADEFIAELDKGYDTLVGERGVKLSGGQKQRVAIARAILKKSPILLLDEATSALDSESEAYIQEALFKLMKSRTSIVIAHRLSTIQHMDRIIVLDAGKIIEDGTHKELMDKSGGVYARLWSHQSGGFLED